MGGIHALPRPIRSGLLASDDWSPNELVPYAHERSERMRRLRFAAQLTSVLNNEFGPTARERRRRAHERAMADPNLAMSRAIVLIGPELAPADAFTPERWDEILV